MESEKVKKIKKAIQETIDGKLSKEYLTVCEICCCPILDIDKLFPDILTLINELEKEVETRKEEVLHLQEYGKKLIRETELKQFAERLKEHPIMKTYSLHNACERIPKAIDETLKEYEK